MPRKKSAARKAKEETEPEVPIQDSLFDDQDQDEDAGFTINEEFARRFEHNKKREDLHRLQEKYKGANLGDDDSDASTSEDEDDRGDLNTPQIDAAIFKMLSKIRNKDPALYTTEGKFFEEAEQEASAAVQKRQKQAKPTTIADLHRQTLLSGRGNEDFDDEEAGDNKLYDQSRGPTHAQEQAELKRAFQNLGDEADSDDDVLVPKKRSGAEAQLEDDQYQDFLKEQLGKGDLLNELKSGNAENPEGEEFLMNYILDRGWIDKNAAPSAPTYGSGGLGNDEEEDEDDNDNDSQDWEETAEKFETTYNFRFEQKGATEITTHPRDIQSVRRKDEKRRKERDHKLEKVNTAKQERLEELNRLKNLKKAELEEKIKRIEEVTGHPMDFDAIDLDGDFDPDQWDSKMLERFNDAYYQDADKKKPTWEDEIDIDDLSDDDTATAADASSSRAVAGTLAPTTTTSAALTKREAKSRKRKIDALVDASVPQAMGPGGRIFRYRQSEPESFGLSIEDILFADDAKLNDYAGLKALVPFKSREKAERDRKKYGAKKRTKQFQKDLWSQSRWRDRATAANDLAHEEAEKTEQRKKKKKKSGGSGGENGMTANVLL